MLGIENIIRKKEEWKKMSKIMKRIYFNKYNWKNMEKSLLKMYDNLIFDNFLEKRS